MGRPDAPPDLLSETQSPQQSNLERTPQEGLAECSQGEETACILGWFPDPARVLWDPGCSTKSLQPQSSRLEDKGWVDWLTFIGFPEKECVCVCDGDTASSHLRDGACRAGEQAPGYQLQ